MARESDERKVFVKGIPEQATRKEIVRFFSYYGQIENCKLKQDPQTKKNLRYALLTFANPDVAKALFDTQVEFFSQTCECKRLYTCKPQAELDEESSLLVLIIPLEAKDEDLKEVLWMCPSIASCFVLKDTTVSTSNQGLGIVVFRDALGKHIFSQWINDPKHAIFLHGQHLKIWNDKNHSKNHLEFLKQTDINKNRVSISRATIDLEQKQGSWELMLPLIRNKVINSTLKFEPTTDKNNSPISSDKSKKFEKSTLSDDILKNGRNELETSRDRNLAGYRSTKAKILRVASKLNNSDKNYRLNGPAASTRYWFNLIEHRTEQSAESRH